jgi:surface antigen
MNPSRHAITLLLLTSVAPLAWPAAWGDLLNDAAITDFSDEDARAYLDTIHTLLDAPLPAAPVEWSNPDHGVGARLEVIGQPHIEGFGECRRVRSSAYSRKHKAQPRTWTACRGNDGGWILVRGT